MNKWECRHAGCTNTAIGVGGAMGLRAIGWWFEPGPAIFCPFHRPDPQPCNDNSENRHNSCGVCSAEAEAAFWQETMLRLGAISQFTWGRASRFLSLGGQYDHGSAEAKP